MREFLDQIIHGDCLEVMQKLPDRCIDVILTDPPYGYLTRKHKFDVPVDWKRVSEEWERICKEDCFIIMFGRGTQLYRWASYLDDLGFDFKEEIVWNKKNPTNPVLPLLRKHELIVVYGRGRKKIKRVRVPYEEEACERKIHQDLQRILSALKGKEKEELLRYIQNDFVKEYTRLHKDKHCITLQAGIKDCAGSVRSLEQILFGLVESSIMSVPREHFRMVHPTQKPVRLIERLLAVFSDEEDIVLDPFVGSGTTAIACKKMKRKFIGIEKDDEYYRLALERLKHEIL